MVTERTVDGGRQNTHSHTIFVDDFIEVTLKIPDRMNALDFHGLLLRVKSIIPKDVLSQQLISDDTDSRRQTNESDNMNQAAAVERQQVRWTPEMNEIIKTYFPMEGTKGVMPRLQLHDPLVTPTRLWAQAAKLGVKGRKTHAGFHWTPEAIATLQQWYPIEGPRGMLQRLNNTHLTEDSLKAAATRFLGTQKWRKVV